MFSAFIFHLNCQLSKGSLLVDSFLGYAFIFIPVGTTLYMGNVGVSDSDKNKKTPVWFYRWTTDNSFQAVSGGFQKNAGVFGAEYHAQKFFSYFFFFPGYALPVLG